MGNLFRSGARMYGDEIEDLTCSVGFAGLGVEN